MNKDSMASENKSGDDVSLSPGASRVSGTPHADLASKRPRHAQVAVVGRDTNVLIWWTMDTAALASGRARLSTDNPGPTGFESLHRIGRWSTEYKGPLNRALEWPPLSRTPKWCPPSGGRHWLPRRRRIQSHRPLSSDSATPTDPE